MILHTPAELARSALKRIAELRLPPTPENFSRFYDEAAGRAMIASSSPALSASSPAAGGALTEVVMERFDDLVGRAVATTEQLASGLDRHDEEMTASLHALVNATVVNEAAELLKSLSAMSRDIQATVKASHAELLDTRRSLAEIQSELSESRKLLRQDPLTGSENRRAMPAILADEIARARREDEPLAVVMLDLDHFKKINDSHGHAAGDGALIHLTRLARSLLRGNDAFIRFGGEEFLMVLPETGLQGGVSAGERLQNMLKRQPFVYEGKAIPMTFSGGVSVLDAADTEDTLVRRADTALYAAKNAGRNRLVAAASLTAASPDKIGDGNAVRVAGCALALAT